MCASSNSFFVGYEIVTSGMCTSHAGHKWVTNSADCGDAAAEVWEEKSWDVTEYNGQSSVPRGCFVAPSSSKEDDLMFNNNMDSTASCTQSVNPNLACLCALLPACLYNDGHTANDGPCVCGDNSTRTVACTHDTGLPTLH